jgi:vitamin B12 transporter
MIRLGRSRLGVIFALLVSADSLLAQRPDSIARVDSIRAARQTEGPRQTLPAVVITGSLSGTSYERLGVAHSIIDRAALRAEPSPAAVDPLRHTTGTYIDEANGPLGPTITRLRGGEETFTQILVDGVQANENGGFFDWLGLTLVNVDRVEVARGPQSAVYGSSAMSGVVQIFSRAGEPGPPRLEALFEGAGRRSYGGSTRGMVEASGGSQRVRYAAGLGSAYDRGPFRLPHDLRSNDVSLRVDLVPKRPFQLTTVARYMGIDSKLPVRDPGATRVPLDPNAQNSRDRVIAALHGAWAPSDRWTHRLTIADYVQDFSYVDVSDGLDPSQYQFFVFDASFRYHSFLERRTARYVGTVASQPRPSLRITVSYGGQWEREALEVSTSGAFGEAETSISRPSVAGFAEAHAQFGERLSLLAGSRVEKFRGLAAAGVPRATAVFDAVPQKVAVRVAVGRAYKALNIQDQFPNNPLIVGNPELRPETSTSWEVGADFAMLRATGSFTVFRQRYDDLIRVASYDESGRQIYRNLGSSRAAGVEAEIVVRPRPRWSVGGGGSWTMTRVLDNRGLPEDQFPRGEPLPFRPAYTATAFAELPATNVFTLLLRASAVGRQTVLSERFSGARRSIDPYAVVMATGTYNVSPSLEAYFHAQNVLDARYDTAFDKPGAPRSAALGLRLRRQL